MFILRITETIQYNVVSKLTSESSLEIRKSIKTYLKYISHFIKVMSSFTYYNFKCLNGFKTFQFKTLCYTSKFVLFSESKFLGQFG